MAVSLDLDYVERNDNKIITLTDISTGWSPNAGSDITTLTLTVSITTSDNVTTTYNTINLYTKFNLNASSTQSDLVFTFSAADFLNSSSGPLGSNTDVFPDGIYEFKYVLNNGLLTTSILDSFVLMEGNCRNAVNEAMRTIPVIYNCKDCKSKQILDAIFAYGYLNSMRAGGYVAKTEELINQLYVLERLLEYGSSYTW